MKNLYFILAFIIISCQFSIINCFAQTSPYIFPPDKKITQFIIDSYTTEDGLPTNNLNAICQTRDGYIWITSYEGIIRYDGFIFKVFNKENTPEFSSNSFFALAEDKNGTLWFTSDENGLVAYKNGSFYTYGKEKGIKTLFSAIYVDRQNRVWSGSPRKGCFYFENEEFHFPTYSTAFSNTEIWRITEDKNGAMYFGTYGKGLYKYADEKLYHYSKMNDLKDELVISLYAQDSMLWVGTRSGPFILKNNIFRENMALKNISINKIFEDTVGNLWFATINGLYRKKYGEKVYENLHIKHGLLHNDVTDGIIDMEGNLWLAFHKGGLARIKNGKFINYDENTGKSSKIVNTVCEYKDKVVLVGFDNGAVNKIDKREVSKMLFHHNINGLRIRHILKDRKNNLWISTYSGLLEVTESGREIWHNPDTGFPSSLVRLTFEDSENTKWVGTRDKGLIKIEQDNSYKIYNMDFGLSANLVMSIEEDHEQNILIGTAGGGLNILSKDEQIYKVYNTKNGLAGNVVFNTYIDSTGIIWTACNGGLSRIYKDEITNYTIFDGLVSDKVYDIVEDDFNNFWMPYSKGIMYVNKKMLNDFAEGKTDKIICKAFNKYDGLKAAGFTATTQSLKTKDGKIWFPSLNGVVVVDPAKISYNNIPPPVYIEELLIDNKTVNLKKQIETEAGKKRFNIRYTAICLHAPEKVRFRYQLVGYDKNWIEVDYNIREVSYTNLSYGDYTFRVKACNNDGLWNETGDTFSFRVKPFFHETILFKIVAILLITGLVFFFFKLRIRQFKKRQEELEQIVTKRTAEVVQQKEEISFTLETVNKQKEEIQTQAAKLKASFKEINKKNSELKISYEKMERIAKTDPLTRLSNRRDFLEKIGYVKAASDRKGKSFVLAIGDIDHFKDFNDNYGHDCGDFVLLSVANLFKAVIRKQDYVGRWGGEEFVFLFPETNLEGGQIITEKIRREIAARTFSYKDLILNITMTFGICVYDKPEEIDIKLKQADEALFKGKKAGKNCVKLYLKNGTC